MADIIYMPKEGITVETCIIFEWFKHVGDAVEISDALFNYETDKAVFECVSSVSGELLEIFCDSGCEVPVLTPVCVVGAHGEDVSALRPDGSLRLAGGTAVSYPEPAAYAIYPPVAPDIPGPAENTGRISPRAGKLAERAGVDPAQLFGTGPNGRVIERDVRAFMSARTADTEAVTAYPGRRTADNGVVTAYPGRRTADNEVATALPGAETAASAPSPAGRFDFEDIKFTRIRKTIAKTMFESLQTMAQLTHTHSFDATEIQHYRELQKARGGEFSGITIGDMIIYAVTRTLKNHPDLNAHLLQGDILRRFSSVNLGVAIDTPRGLMVPTVFDADKKTLIQISGEVKSLAAKCREGSISPDALSFGSFTVSNLGNLGVESFTPVINPPQTGVLGVCGITLRPCEKDGSIVLYPAMSLSLTYDHRAVDGAPASRFLKELCENLERFSALLEE